MLKFSFNTVCDNLKIQSTGCGFATFATFKGGKFEIIKKPEQTQLFAETENWTFLRFSPDGTKTVWCVTCPSIHYATLPLIVVLNNLNYEEPGIGIIATCGSFSYIADTICEVEYSLNQEHLLIASSGGVLIYEFASRKSHIIVNFQNHMNPNKMISTFGSFSHGGTLAVIGSPCIQTTIIYSVESKQILVELPVVSNWAVFAPERESVIIVGSALSTDIQWWTTDGRILNILYLPHVSARGYLSPTTPYTRLVVESNKCCCIFNNKNEKHHFVVYFDYFSYALSWHSGEFSATRSLPPSIKHLPVPDDARLFSSSQFIEFMASHLVLSFCDFKWLQQYKPCNRDSFPVRKGEQIKIDFSVEIKTEKEVKAFTDGMVSDYKRRGKMNESETIQFVKEYVEVAKQKGNFGCSVLDEFPTHITST